jgi:hypothetical protein
MWLERHGNAPLQDIWAFGELDSPLPCRQERSVGGIYQQDQVGSKDDNVDALRTTEHHLKLFRGEAGAEVWRSPELAETKAGRDIPWWNSLNASLN